MFITRMALPRRTFIRGLGVSLALPLLDSMVPALTATTKTAASPVRRLGFVYVPNGVAQNSKVNLWRPSGEGTGFAWSPILKPLEAHRQQAVVISGLSHPQAESLGDGAGDHTRASVTWLNGVHPKKTESADLRSGITADQLAARVLGRETVLPSIEVGASDFDNLIGNCENGYSCVYMSSISWRGSSEPNRAEINPRVVFEELFGDGGTREQRLGQVRQKGSLLDHVTAELGRLQRSLGSADRVRITEYLESVREVERRIQHTETADEGAALPSTLERPSGIPALFSDHARLMYDLLALAYQADITRVFTFMMGKELSGRPFPEIGITEGHHSVSHHGDRLEQLEKLAKINQFQVELFVEFLNKLKGLPDGDGSILDHTLLMYGAGLGNPNEHLHVELPVVLAGGASGQLIGGRHIAYPEEKMTNLLLSVLDKVGVPVDELGDSTGKLSPDPLVV